MSEGVRKRAAKSSVRILIVDDHPIVRKGIIQLIGDEPDLLICGEANSAQSAMDEIDATRPDLVILDLTLAGMNGLGLIREMKGKHPGVQILVLSMHDESFYAERVLRAGASGYIMKQEATDHIVEAIRQVVSGQVCLSETMAAKLLHRFVGERQPSGASVLDTLSNREIEVFHLLAEGLSTRQIAARLFLSIKTVETHLEHMKTKLAVDSGRELVRYATRWSLEQH